MKTILISQKNIVIAACLSLAFLLSACHKQASHEHGHEHGDSQTMTKPSGEKFVTDDALRSGMRQVYDSMTALHEPGSDTLKIADNLDAAVKDIIAKCKLEPDADNAIHPALADIQAAAALLRKKNDIDAMDKLHHALGVYEANFAPTGW